MLGSMCVCVYLCVHMCMLMHTYVYNDNYRGRDHEFKE